jgi:chemotaxis protein CheD
MKVKKQKIFVEPGYVYLPLQPTLLYTVIGSGVVVTLFDKVQRLGGMNYFSKPVCEDENYPTSLCAFPAIIGLLNMFEEAGSQKINLEANIYGGAENPEAENYIPELGEQNIQAAIYTLEQKEIQISNKDVGSTKGRKLIFNSGSGEVLIAKIDNIGKHNWYPKIEN